MTSLRVLTYNIYLGGSDRSEAICEVLTHVNADVVSLTEEIIRALPELSVATTPDAPIPVTFFEMTTAIALAYFVQKKVDMGILEVGMGGRLDATNVCHPVLSMITTISLEHREFLGQTIVEIAREKGGIIKTEVPVILGVSYPRAKSELEIIAKQKGAPVHRLGREFRVKAQAAVCRSHLRSIQEAVESYYDANGEYPRGGRVDSDHPLVIDRYFDTPPRCPTTNNYYVLEIDETGISVRCDSGLEGHEIEEE